MDRTDGCAIARELSQGCELSDKPAAVPPIARRNVRREKCGFGKPGSEFIVIPFLWIREHNAMRAGDRVRMKISRFHIYAHNGVPVRIEIVFQALMYDSRRMITNLNLKAKIFRLIKHASKSGSI